MSTVRHISTKAKLCDRRFRRVVYERAPSKRAPTYCGAPRTPDDVDVRSVENMRVAARHGLPHLTVVTRETLAEVCPNCIKAAGLAAQESP